MREKIEKKIEELRERMKNLDKYSKIERSICHGQIIVLKELLENEEA